MRSIALLTFTAAVATTACSGSGIRSPTTTATTVLTSQPAGGRPVTLTCIQAIAGAAPTSDLTVVLGVVALPASPAMKTALQASASGEVDPSARLFAKWGLHIRSDAAFELIVPAEVADRLWVGWGSPGPRTKRLVVDRCRGTSQWLVFAGGYWVPDPGCMPLFVRSGGREQRVMMGIGAPCPGQLPPPAPTSS